MKEEGHLYLERSELIQRAYTMLNQDLPHQAVTEWTSSGTLPAGHAGKHCGRRRAGVCEEAV